MSRTSTTRHRTEQVRVDFNDLFHGPGRCEQDQECTKAGSIPQPTNIASCCCSGIYCDDDAPFEPESQCCGSVLDFDLTVGIGMVIGVESQKCGWLDTEEV